MPHVPTHGGRQEVEFVRPDITDEVTTKVWSRRLSFALLSSISPDECFRSPTPLRPSDRTGNGRVRRRRVPARRKTGGAEGGPAVHTCYPARVLMLLVALLSTLPVALPPPPRSAEGQFMACMRFVSASDCLDHERRWSRPPRRPAGFFGRAVTATVSPDDSPSEGSPRCRAGPARRVYLEGVAPRPVPPIAALVVCTPLLLRTLRPGRLSFDAAEKAGRGARRQAP